MCIHNEYVTSIFFYLTFTHVQIRFEKNCKTVISENFARYKSAKISIKHHMGLMRDFAHRDITSSVYCSIWGLAKTLNFPIWEKAQKALNPRSIWRCVEHPLAPSPFCQYRKFNIPQDRKCFNVWFQHVQ